MKSCYARFSAKRFEMLVRKGWTDQECADFFDISISQITLWKKNHPEFLISLKKWKESADYHVEKSLYERAMGYTHDAVKMFVVKNEVIQVPYKEHYPPDSTALIFWLKNRKPQEWRDKEGGDKQVDTKIIIIRDDKKPVVIETQKEQGGRLVSINP